MHTYVSSLGDDVRTTARGSLFFGSPSAVVFSSNVPRNVGSTLSTTRNLLSFLSSYLRTNEITSIESVLYLSRFEFTTVLNFWWTDGTLGRSLLSSGSTFIISFLVILPVEIPSSSVDKTDYVHSKCLRKNRDVMRTDSSIINDRFK